MSQMSDWLEYYNHSLRAPNTAGASAKDYYFSGINSPQPVPISPPPARVVKAPPVTKPSSTGNPTSTLPSKDAWDEYYSHSLRGRPGGVEGGGPPATPDGYWDMPGLADVGEGTVNWLKKYAPVLVPDPANFWNMPWQKDSPPSTTAPVVTTPTTPAAANPGYWSPTSTMRPPPASAPAPVAPVSAAPDLNTMLTAAQIDNLTSTGNAKPADLSGLEAAASKLAPNKWETLMRFGLATAAGTSPHFGVNVGAGGISALDARDQGLARYNTAMQNIATMKETSRSNLQRERTDAIVAATPPARASTAVSPVLKGIIDTQQAIWTEQAKAIMDPNNMTYASDPEARDKAMEALRSEIANFYAALGTSGDTPEVDLSAE